MNRPNLVVVLADQLRRDALSCYGDPNIQTPHIDRLAARGTRFVNTCSTYPICVPFRFTLMTGEYAHSRMIPGIEWRMSPAERTLADELNDGGYTTMYVGKWHLHGGYLHMPGYGARHEGVKPVPRAYQGRWTHWRGFELRNSPFDTYYFVDDDPTPRPVPGYQTDGLFDIGMDVIREKREAGTPFACVISVEPPHPPFEAPEELEQKWLQRDLELPPNFLTYDTDDGPRRAILGHDERPLDRDAMVRQRQIYYAMVENIDDNMGRLADFLEAEGLTEDTIVVFMADHGEMAGSHGLAQKQWAYETSSGIPYLMAGPGVAAGATVTAPTATEDFFPTFLGLCGLTARNQTPGLDVSPVIRGEQADLPRDGVMLEFVSENRPGMPFFSCIYRGWRSERYKYVVAGDLHGMQPWQFFDLQTDPHELENRLADPTLQAEIARHHAALRERMATTLDDAALAAAHDCPGLNLEWFPAAD